MKCITKHMMVSDENMMILVHKNLLLQVTLITKKAIMIYKRTTKQSSYLGFRYNACTDQ